MGGFGVQLSGGIVRYLHAFPSGGFFSGQNFVFDPRWVEGWGCQLASILWLKPNRIGRIGCRLAVGSEDGTLIGCCLQCGARCNDYAKRCRCATCRMLVLVCKACQVSSASIAARATRSPPGGLNGTAVLLWC